jgi:hypothetical protein
MKDPRGKHAEVNAEEDAEYPCIKVFATMDSPLEDVCEFLSQKKNMNQYNDLVIDHRDLEEISPHSKITWSQCPQILFLKVRAIAIKTVVELNGFLRLFSIDVFCSHKFSSFAHGIYDIVEGFCDVLPSSLEKRWNSNRSESGMQP